jgi:uncharacterized protein (TIGR02117 family)
VKPLNNFNRWLRTRPWPLRWAVKGALVALLLVSPLLLYLLVAWVLGSLHANHNFVEASPGVEVFVWSNGVHTDLVVPAQHEVMDWRPWLSSSNASHIAFGWGDKGFFLEVPEWRDLTFKVAFNALVIDGEAAMHVTLLEQPPPRSATCRRVTISAGQYRTLAEYLRGSFKLDSQGLPRRIAAPGYGDNDAFYEATGHYGPINTCNEWTGRGLRAAGIKTGVWTPFESAVMKHLPE